MKNKICTRCKKKDKQFYKDSSKADGFCSWCVECKKETRTYKPDKAREKVRARQKKKEYYNILYEYIHTEHPICTVCGFTHTSFAPFAWHHIDRKTKIESVSRMQGSKKWKIIEELDKCELLCSNCHNIHHETERKANEEG